MDTLICDRCGIAVCRKCLNCGCNQSGVTCECPTVVSSMESAEKLVRSLVEDVRRLKEEVSSQEQMKFAARDDASAAKNKLLIAVVALAEVFRREGPGPDGSSENATGKIAREALQKVT